MRFRPAVIALVFSVSAAAATGESAYFSTISTRDGLPNASVSAIAQDGLGFLWFGTQGGLVRYDGYAFKHFENEPFASNVLSHNQVQTLLMDGDVLWIGTYGGLNRLDLRTEAFTVFKNDPADPASLSSDLVIAVERDSAGRLWVGTSKGLNRLDEETGRFVRFNRIEGDLSSIPDDLVRDIHEDASGTLWIATGGGLARLRGDGRFDRANVDPDDPGALPAAGVMSIAESPAGELWFGCWNGGLARLADRASLRFETKRLPDERVYFVNAQEEGVLMVGTWGGGLVEYRPSDGRLYRRRAGQGPGSLSHDVVYSALLDANGVFWIGTNGGGINRTDRRDAFYEAYMHDPEKPASLSSGKVSAVLEDRSGRLWVGVYNGGLNRYDPATGGFVHYRHDPAKPRGLSNDIVNYLYEDAAGDLWIGTNEGLCRYAPRTDDFDVFRNDPADPASLPDPVVYVVKDAPGGDLWIGTYTKGLARLEKSTGRFVRYPIDPLGDAGTADSLVFALEYDARGRLWIGMNKGLDRLDGGRFVHYRYDQDNREGISFDTVRNVFRDSRGRMWMGTAGGGLMRYDEENDRFVHFMKKQGLPNNAVRSIIEASDGSLWIGTARGIGVIDPDGDFFRGFSVYNDLKDREFHIGTWRSKDGSLYFGGMNALYRLLPTARRGEIRVPRLVVSEIRVGDKPLKDGPAAPYVESLRLEYNRNDFAVLFSTVDFRDPGRNLYSHKLEGFDTEWTTPTSERSVVYTNLPGGRYRFLVRASDNEGYWNDSALDLPVDVGYPPWFSPPALVLYLFALVGLGYMVASLKGKSELSAKVVELTALKVELEAANVRLADLSMIDGLTGIANRRRLDEVLPHVYAESAREGRPLSILMLDLDFFKGYNDCYGHLMGDEALRQVAATILGSIERATDLAARFGGEEFIVMLSNTDEAGARRVAERIRSAVEALSIPTEASKASDVVTISAGVASAVPTPEGSAKDLVEAADAALYRAKQSGRNRVA